MAFVYRGYWIDIGTPAKYMQVHRDIMDGHFRSAPFADVPLTAWIAPDARIEEGAIIEGPCFIDEGVVVKAGARIGPYSVIGKQCHVEEHATIHSFRANTASVRPIVRDHLARHCHIGRARWSRTGRARDVRGHGLQPV
jgi:NDP-sugar pyrophosphorylase family protein